MAIASLFVLANTRDMYTQEHLLLTRKDAVSYMHVYNTDELMGTEYSQSWFALGTLFQCIFEP